MSTPAKARALRALAAAKKRNVTRVANGDKPMIAGKPVSPSTIGLTQAKAKKIIANRKKS